MTDVAATAEAGAEPAIEQETGPEAEARKGGWKPEAEWDGDPDDWMPAREFTKYARLKTNLKSEYEKRFAKLEKMSERREAAVRKEADEKIAALKAQKQAAVKAGNVEQVERIDQKIDELKTEVKDDPVSPASSDDDDPGAEAKWGRKNPWYGKDEEMTRYAERYSQGLLKKNPNITMTDNLRQVDAEMRREFPDYEWDAKPEKTTGANGHAPVDGGGFGGGRREDPLSKLPNEARAQCKKDMAAFPKQYPSVQKWIEVYNS